MNLKNTNGNGSNHPASERKRTVLVVDDRPTALFAIGALLRDHGFHVLTAPDVAGGLAILDEWAIDAIVADLRLGDGKPDGAVLLDSARRWHPGIRTRLLLTADNLGADLARETESVWIDRGEPGSTGLMVELLKEATRGHG